MAAHQPKVDRAMLAGDDPVAAMMDVPADDMGDLRLLPDQLAYGEVAQISAHQAVELALRVVRQRLREDRDVGHHHDPVDGRIIDQPGQAAAKRRPRKRAMATSLHGQSMKSASWLTIRLSKR